MAATIDIFTNRNQLPAAPTTGTLAVIQTASRTVELWVFLGGLGWHRATHGAATNPGE
jgi:hypothetical protein